MNEPTPNSIRWEVATNDNPPQMIFCEAFEEAVIVRKQDMKLGVGMTILELEATVAVLNWILKAGITLAEAEHARDIFNDVKLGVEGK